MALAVSIFQKVLTKTCCTGSFHENVPVPEVISSNLQSTDGLTVLARIEIAAILVHYQPSYNTSHTMKPIDPLLLANVTLRCSVCVCVCMYFAFSISTDGGNTEFSKAL